MKNQEIKLNQTKENGNPLLIGEQNIALFNAMQNRSKLDSLSKKIEKMVELGVLSTQPSYKEVEEEIKETAKLLDSNIQKYIGLEDNVMRAIELYYFASTGKGQLKFEKESLETEYNYLVCKLTNALYTSQTSINKSIEQQKEEYRVAKDLLQDVYDFLVGVYIKNNNYKSTIKVKQLEVIALQSVVSRLATTGKDIMNKGLSLSSRSTKSMRKEVEKIIGIKLSNNELKIRGANKPSNNSFLMLEGVCNNAENMEKLIEVCKEVGATLTTSTGIDEIYLIKAGKNEYKLDITLENFEFVKIEK